MTNLLIILLAITTLITTFEKWSKYIHRRTFKYKDFFHIALSGIPMILVFLFQLGFDNSIYTYISTHIFMTLGLITAFIGLALSWTILLLKITEGYEMTKDKMVIVGSTILMSFIFIIIGFYQT